MNMLDTEIQTTINPDGGVQEERLVTERDFSEACEKFLAANKKFERLDRNPDKYGVRPTRIFWWDALETVYQAECEVRKLFIGSQPSPESNRQYAQFRELLLAGRPTKANA